MKVLFIDQIAKVNYKYSFSLVNALNEKECNITLVIDQKKEPENCKVNRINLFNTDEKDISKISKLNNYYRSYKEIIKLVEFEKYDILHIQWTIFSPLDFYFLNKIKKKYKTKLIMTIHDILPFNKKIYDKFFHEKIYSLADHLIVQAENNVNRFKKIFPNNKAKISMIPHGHLMNYANIIDKKTARQYFNIDEKKFVFLFFGQIKKVKGLGILLEAYSKIFKSYPNTLLVVAGSVWKDSFEQYKKIIEKNELQKQLLLNIKYIPDEEVKYYYSSADICVLPYLDVYQSGVIQLAYAYKKPVIASDIGAFKEVVLDGETGYLSKVADDNELSQIMIKSIEEKNRLSVMGELGYKFIKNKYSWGKIAEKIISKYTT
ncbi:glycosyltransferase family 4 protein [Eubacterium maltosivorans]|uniref:glycosyltransferase family 4 protein n=1 Tax=Eubacterium maltosivorans TaxID=2041044 RepID=UPI00189D4BBA|nr:glycosyltransferase family 4 protein [Eubacterium maltosivorans]